MDNNKLSIEEAVDIAIDECIKEGVLVDILEKDREEVKTMLVEEYYEELHIHNEKEISYEEGLEQGAEVLAGVIDRMRDGESAESLLQSGVTKNIVDLASKYV